MCSPAPGPRRRWTPTAPPSRGGGWCRGCCATSPSATSRRRCSGPRCRRRCCWRRSASRRSSTRTASWRPRARPAALGVPMIASTASALHPRGDRRGRAATGRAGSSSTGRTSAAIVESFVRRAEAAGYGAIVVTVDTFIPGWKPRDLQQAWLPFLQGMGVANFFQDPVFREGLEKPPEEDVGAATGHFLGVYVNPSLTWDDLGLAARADLAADPRQGHPARRRRPRSGRPRPRRDRRLQPRRPPGRRRDRLARRPRRRSPRRSATTSPSSSTAASAAAATSSRRSPSAPTPSSSAAPTSGASPSRASRASKPSSR